MRRVLVWKWEDGPPDAPPEGTPQDVGPAWVITYDGDRALAEEDVAGGDWITRAEAARLAKEQGFDLDDGAQEQDHGAVVTSVDPEALNSRLREIGVTERELLIERSGDDFILSGTIPDEHARQRGPKVTASPGAKPHLIQLVVGETGLYALLDSFAPGWR